MPSLELVNKFFADTRFDGESGTPFAPSLFAPAP
jgi:hypothetical protein